MFWAPAKTALNRTLVGGDQSCPVKKASPPAQGLASACSADTVRLRSTALLVQNPIFLSNGILMLSD